MTDLTILHNPRCSTSRAASAICVEGISQAWVLWEARSSKMRGSRLSRTSEGSSERQVSLGISPVARASAALRRAFPGPLTGVWASCERGHRDRRREGVLQRLGR